MIKKLIFPLFSALLLYWSYEMLNQLIRSQAESFNLMELLILGFLLNLYLTGVFAFVGFAYPSSKILPPSYYKIHKIERLKVLYKYLGVGIFRKLLLIFFWGSKKNRKKFFNGTKAGIEAFIFETHQAEFGHVAAFTLISIIAMLLLIYGYFLLVIWILLINIIGNLYPVILQRHHRIRIQKLLDNSINPTGDKQV